MDMNLLAKNNELNKERANEVTNFQIAEEQKSFLDSNLGKVIDGAVDIGIKALLPDIIEDDIIEIKDVMVEEGFEEGVKTAIDKAVEVGKGISKIFTGDFKSIFDAKNAVQAGELAKGVSEILDGVLNMAEKKNILSPNIANILSTGKDLFFGTISQNIESDFEKQIKSVEKVERYIDNWTKYYNEKDLKSMENQYKYMQRELKELMPLENILNKAREVENLHNLIKNKGSFNISKNEQELAEQLA